MKSLKLSWVNRFIKWLTRSNFEQVNQQSFTRLYTIFQNVEKKDDSKYQFVEEQLQKLQNNADWNTVKLVELLLIPLLDEYDLEMELHYQLHKAEALFGESEYKFFKGEFEIISGEPNTSKLAKRALLSQLTESLYMYYEDRQLRSVFANSARLKIGVFFSIAIFFSVFLLAISIIHPNGIYQYFSLQGYNFYWVASVDAVNEEIVDKTQHADKIHLHYAITALMAGGMGSCFSMLISLKSRIETVTLQELANIHSLHFIVTRIITGVGAALICYYFFRADLLSGSLFPDFRSEKEITLSSRSFFTLIIWCFIAGFSEKLVPSILSKTEAQLDKK